MPVQTRITHLLCNTKIWNVCKCSTRRFSTDGTSLVFVWYVTLVTWHFIILPTFEVKNKYIRQGITSFAFVVRMAVFNSSHVAEMVFCKVTFTGFTEHFYADMISLLLCFIDQLIAFMTSKVCFASCIAKFCFKWNS